MDARSLPPASIARFNDEAAALALRWRKIVERMERRGWDRRDPSYRLAVAIRDTALTLAAETHRLRSQHRDTLREYSKKRSASSRDRTARRDDAECGLGPLPPDPRPIDPNELPY